MILNATILVSALTASIPQRFENPVTIVESIEAPQELIERAGNRTQVLLRDGDRFTFIYRSDAAEAKLTSWLGATLKPHGRSGFHLAQIVVPGSDKLLMSYAFSNNDEEVAPRMIDYRGSNAPEIPQSVAVLDGQHLRYSIDSTHLGEARAFEVYVPKTKQTDLPVVYMTDGRYLQDYVGALDWKIRNGELAPVVVVGIHSGGYVGDRKWKFRTELDHRALEYLGGLGNERYEQHKMFVNSELIPFIEAKHGVSRDPSKRVLSGYSNGAAYALTAAIEEPESFGHVAAYSVAYFDREALKQSAEKAAKLPAVRLAGGELERFIMGTRAAHSILDEAGAEVQLRSFVAGHDGLMWRVALLEDLVALFPGKNATAGK